MIAFACQLLSLWSQPGSPPPGTTAALLRRFQAADAIAAKEKLLDRIAQRGREAGKGLLRVAQTTDDTNTRWLAIRGLGIMKYRP
ncbi:MAG TPA: hypothetical protein VJ732_12180, partial [Bryobacteraceae bacterium]|nr:hypothetical protein [Bryobacteraceae bacterium]